MQTYKRIMLKIFAEYYLFHRPMTGAQVDRVVGMVGRLKSDYQRKMDDIPIVGGSGCGRAYVVGSANGKIHEVHVAPRFNDLRVQDQNLILQSCAQSLNSKGRGLVLSGERNIWHHFQRYVRPLVLEIVMVKRGYVEPSDRLEYEHQAVSGHLTNMPFGDHGTVGGNSDTWLQNLYHHHHMMHDDEMLATVMDHQEYTDLVLRRNSVLGASNGSSGDRQDISQTSAASSLDPQVALRDLPPSAVKLGGENGPCTPPAILAGQRLRLKARMREFVRGLWKDDPDRSTSWLYDIGVK